MIAASLARPSERSIIAWTPARGEGAPLVEARQRPHVAAIRAAACGPRSSRPASSSSPAAAAPSVPVTPTRSPGRAPSRPRRLGVGPADHGHRHERGGARHDVAAGDRHAAASPRAPRRRAQRERRRRRRASRRRRGRRRPRRRRRPSPRDPTARRRARGGRRRRGRPSRGGSGRPRPSSRSRRRRSAPPLRTTAASSPIQRATRSPRTAARAAIASIRARSSSGRQRWR